MRTIQHEIPGKGEYEPLQQRIVYTYMLFVLLSLNILINILSVWMTCKVCHHTWFSRLHPPHNKSWKIRLHIDFRNLNPSRSKKNYPMPSSEPMLQTVPKIVVLSSLEGFLECHQVPVAEPGGSELVHEKLGSHTYHLQSLDGRIDDLPVKRTSPQTLVQ